MRTALIAALPGELKQIVRTGWQRVPTRARHTHKWVGREGANQWIAVCAGMGANAARRAFAEAEMEGAIDQVISLGWAGSLDGDVRSPDTHIATTVVDAQTGERFQLTEGTRKLVLVSTAGVADQMQKQRLAATYGGSMVDMESAAVVRLAQMRGIPVCCVKAISDDVGETLPDFNRFIDTEGQLRLPALVLHCLLRPGSWGTLLRLGRKSDAGAHTLAETVGNILRGSKDFAEINRTGHVK